MKKSGGGAAALHGVELVLGRGRGPIRSQSISQKYLLVWEQSPQEPPLGCG